MSDKISFEKFGTGKEHIIFLHAFPLDGRMWMQQVLHLKDDYTIIVPDMRCFGKSATSENVFCSMETYSNDVLQIINDLDIDKAILCGLSIGGYIILRSLQKFPERISKIILADTKSENDDNAGLINRANTIIKLQDNKKDEVIEGLLGKLLCKNTIENKSAVVNDAKANMQQQTALAMMSATAALAMRTNTKESLKEINIPALILVGEEDVITPPSASETLHNNIANSEMQIIKNAGHLSNFENPEDFNAALSQFLKK
ncbi:MAG: alpha/beta hydrolase [Fimbriimonadaceae bacterium]|nr:alpha/beta hydrolase [Chitinophagales bacterium]